MENSKRLVEVSRVQCSACENEFYEFEGKEFGKCPYCKANFLDIKADVIKTEQVQIQVNYLTGEISKVEQ